MLSLCVEVTPNLGVRMISKLISAPTLAVCRLNSPSESVELGKDVRGILGYLHFS